MRLIDADAYKSRLRELFDAIVKYKPECAAGIERAIFVLYDAPTVDPADIVRCKDCEHSDRLYWCGIYGGYRSGDSYCLERGREEAKDAAD